MEEIKLRYNSWDTIIWGQKEYDNIERDRENNIITIKNILFSGYRKKEEIKIPYNLALEISFINCQFNSYEAGENLDLLVSGSLPCDIEFQNCKLKSLAITQAQSLRLANLKTKKLELSGIVDLSILNTRSSKWHIDSSTLTNEFNISDQKIDSFVLKDSSLASNISFHNNIFDLLEIAKCKSTNSTLQIRKNLFNSPINISNASLKKISIQTNKGGSISFADSSCQELSVYANKCNLQLSNNKVKKGKINLNRTSEIGIHELEVEEVLFVEKNVLKDKLSFSTQDLTKVKISQNTSDLFMDNVGANSTSFPNLEMNNFASTEISNAKRDQEWTVCLSNFKSLTLKNIELSQLGIEVINGESVHFLDCNFNLDIKAINTHQIKANGVNSTATKLDLQKVNSCILSSSGITDLNVLGREVDLLKVMASVITESCFVLSESNEIHLNDNESSTIILKESNLKVFDLDTNDSKSTDIDQVLVKNSTVEDFVTGDVRIKQFKINNLAFQRFNSATKYLFNLKVLNCTWNNVLFQTEIGQQDDEVQFHCKHLPIDSLEILDSTLQRFSIHVDDIVILTNEEHTRTKLKFNSSKITTASITKFTGPLISSNDCDWKHLKLEMGGSTNNLSRDFQFKGGSIENCTMEDLKGELKFDKVKFAGIEVSNSNFTNIDVISCEKLDDKGDMTFANLKLSKLNLDKSRFKSLVISETKPKEVWFNKLSIENLSFRAFAQTDPGIGTFEMNFINTDIDIRGDTLMFEDCNLTGLRLNSCYFDSFKKLSVKSSELDEVKCTATTWPKIVDSPESSVKQFEIREACRQLKLAMADHQDKVSELQFHSLEMKAYSKIVKARGWKPRNWNDRLSLLAGATNKFGLNWFLPLILIFLSISVIYLGLLWSHFGIVPFSEGYLSCFTPADYFQLYNPTHRLGLLSLEGPISGLTASLDFLSKLVSAFFIYQIVAAFRKFRKK